MAFDLNNAAVFDEYWANSFTSNNTNTLSQQNDNTERRDMDSYNVHFAETLRRNTSSGFVQNTCSPQVYQINPYNPSLGRIFNNGAALVEHDTRTPTQGPNLPRGNELISNSPFQENATVGLTANGLITPLVDQRHVGNIQGAHQARATLSDQSVTSVQNPQSSQGASAPHLQQKNPTCNQVAAHIRRLSKAKADAEKNLDALLMENRQLRIDNQQMRTGIQQMQAHIGQQDKFKQHLEHQNNQLREFAKQAHHGQLAASGGRPSNKEMIKAWLDPAHTATGPNSHGPAAQHPLQDKSGSNPVSATPTAVLNQNGRSTHPNEQPATPAPHNPLGYLSPAYAGKAYPTPPDTEQPRIITTFPTVSSLQAFKPQAETIDLTLDEFENDTPMTQIAADTTDINKAPASDEHSRDHYVNNSTSKVLGGPKKEPPWINGERVKVKEQMLNEVFARGKSKSKRKAEAEEGPVKKAKTGQDRKATKPVQEEPVQEESVQGKPVKKPRVSAKPKARTAAKKCIAEPAADTAFSDKERKDKETLEFAHECGDELTAVNEKDAEKEAQEAEKKKAQEAQKKKEQEQEQLEWADEYGEELTAANEKEAQEKEALVVAAEAGINAQSEPGAEDNLDAELNENKQYKADACIDPTPLVVNHELKGQHADKEEEVTVDRPSSPFDSLFENDGSSCGTEDSRMSNQPDS